MSKTILKNKLNDTWSYCFWYKKTDLWFFFLPMAAVDSGVETESESFNEDSSNSLPSTPKVEEDSLHGVRIHFYQLMICKNQKIYSPLL